MRLSIITGILIAGIVPWFLIGNPELSIILVTLGMLLGVGIGMIFSVGGAAIYENPSRSLIFFPN